MVLLERVSGAWEVVWFSIMDWVIWWWRGWVHHQLTAAPHYTFNSSFLSLRSVTAVWLTCVCSKMIFFSWTSTFICLKYGYLSNRGTHADTHTHTRSISPQKMETYQQSYPKKLSVPRTKTVLNVYIYMCVCDTHTHTVYKMQ